MSGQHDGRSGRADGYFEGFQQSEEPAGATSLFGEMQSWQDMIGEGKGVIDNAVQGNIGGIILWALEKLGIDVMGWIEGEFVGDFERMKASIERVNDTSRVMVRCGVACETSVVNLRPHWTGEAADAALSRVDELGASLVRSGRLHLTLSVLAGKALEKLTELVAKAMEACQHLIESALNKAVNMVAGTGKFQLAWRALRGENPLDEFSGLVDKWHEIEARTAEIRRRIDEARTLYDRAKEDWDAFRDELDRLEEMVDIMDGFRGVPA